MDRLLLPRTIEAVMNTFFRLVLLVTLLTAGSAAAENRATVDIIISGSSDIHRSFSDTLTQLITRRAITQVDIRVINTEDTSSGDFADSRRDLIVSVGTQATAWAISRAGQQPLLATLIPQRSFKTLMAEQPELLAQGKRSAIFIDQPLQRQVRLLKLLFPAAHRVGALFAPGSDAIQHQLASLLTDQSLHLEKTLVADSDNPVPPLEQLLNRSDVFLAVPEPTIFNRHSLTGILLTTYRYRVPVIGFSNAYVRAGALAATYSSAEQIAQQTADNIIARIDKPDAPLPSPAHPRYYSIAVNDQVARSLGLELLDTALLRERLAQLERDQP